MGGTEIRSILCFLSCGCKCGTASTLRRGYVFFAPKDSSLVRPYASDSFTHLFRICTKGIFKLVVALLESSLLCLNGSFRSSDISEWCFGSWPHSCWGWVSPKGFPIHDGSPSSQACHPPRGAPGELGTRSLLLELTM